MKPESIKQVSHETALKALARETNTPTEEVMRLYRDEFAKLEAGAKIRTFVPALALRRARARLHERRHPA